MIHRAAVPRVARSLTRSQSKKTAGGLKTQNEFLNTAAYIISEPIALFDFYQSSAKTSNSTILKKCGLSFGPDTLLPYLALKPAVAAALRLRGAVSANMT